ncbi:uncharacterized protein LOC131665987 [Phymastichus coffea]|uniref:uncharacterized protein LOC131665987 n=1 Tax=Phymastichus coffea TaxID=108790 RepID=UPI00273ACC88|nr:uncharacterized protein LOC131665987 [Phymastichus coffea]
MAKFETLHFRKGSFFKVVVVAAILAKLGVYDANADEVPAFFLKIAKHVPRIGRSELNEHSFDTTADDYHASQISKRKIGFQSEFDTQAWQNFPLTIEGPPELWRTLAGYSKDSLHKASVDFNNELWMRDKRTKVPQV